jgi:hypothetical protein
MSMTTPPTSPRNTALNLESLLGPQLNPTPSSNLGPQLNPTPGSIDGYTGPQSPTSQSKSQTLVTQETTNTIWNTLARICQTIAIVCDKCCDICSGPDE